MVSHIVGKLLLTLITLRTSDALINIKNFQKNPTLSNKLCQIASLDFGLLRKLALCAARCSESGDCRSFFYNKQTMMCKGAPELVVSLYGCQDTANTRYYEG